MISRTVVLMFLVFSSTFPRCLPPRRRLSKHLPVVSRPISSRRTASITSRVRPPLRRPTSSASSFWKAARPKLRQRTLSLPLALK
nr:hypothetical protein I308_03680 [Cryptococcus tetragattii IND107]